AGRPWTSLAGWEAITSSGPGLQESLAVRRCKPPEDASRAAVRGRGYRLFFAPAVIAESGRVSLTTRPPKAQTPIIAQVPRTTPALSRNWGQGGALERLVTGPAGVASAEGEHPSHCVGQLSGKRTEGRSGQLRPGRSFSIFAPIRSSSSMTAVLKQTPLYNAHIAAGARMV